jgi:hypothetical protein
MIGFIDAFFVQSLNYKKYSTIADLHTLKFTVAHKLGFLVSTSPILAVDLNTEIITSNYYEAFLSFLVQSFWNADSPELDQILQFYLQSCGS